MRLKATIKFNSEEYALKNRLTEELVKLAQKYEAEAQISAVQEDGQCSNCGALTEHLHTECIYRDGNPREIQLCMACDNKYMDREKAEEIALFEDFQEGRG